LLDFIVAIYSKDRIDERVVNVCEHGHLYEGSVSTIARLGHWNPIAGTTT